jgi:uracil-DNA glycosylase family 4
MPRSCSLGRDRVSRSRSPGAPSSGPAGRVLDEALAAVGIDRSRLWITNALKHWATTVNERGRKVNRPPRMGELQACRVWWEGEVAIVRPRILVCVGAPAAQAVINKNFKISQERGQWFSGPNGEDALAMFHPSYLLRLRSADPDAYERAWALVLDDLRAVIARAEQHGISLA